MVDDEREARRHTDMEVGEWLRGRAMYGTRGEAMDGSLAPQQRQPSQFERVVGGGYFQPTRGDVCFHGPRGRDDCHRASDWPPAPSLVELLGNMSTVPPLGV